MFHDPARSALFTSEDNSGRVTGFAGRFQTGIDLFRPLVTLRCQTAECAADLLAEALTPGRAYIFFASLNQLPLVGGSLRFDNERLLHIYELDVARFEPVLNVLTRCTAGSNGLPRCTIELNGAQASAGLNWQSPAFSEVYVYTDPSARGRGWGSSVLSAVTQAVIDSGRVPLYLVEHDNEASREMARKLGYVDSGAWQVYADVVYEGHPNQRDAGETV